MSPTISPIAPWPLIAVVAIGIIALTLWAYRLRLRGSTGRWRWIALGLRLAAVLLCVLAALKPSLLVMRKIKQTAGVVFLLDSSSSMGITDEVNNQSRWDTARHALDDWLKILKPQEPQLVVKALRFDSGLHEFNPEETAPPEGRQTALGTALDETLKRMAGTRLVSVLVLSDGASNAGMPPLLAAERLKGQGVPVVGVGYGSENAGETSRDIAVRELIAGPTVFVKNELEVRGTLSVRGFPNQPIEVELFVEGQNSPVATTTVRAKPGSDTVPVSMKWTPQLPGEFRLTLKSQPKEGELVQTNNQISNYITVQKGGLAVLYLQGPNWSWDVKYLPRAVDSAQEIQLTLRILRRPAEQDPSVLPLEELAPGHYDVIIIGDLPANYLSRLHRDLIVRSVQDGAGLMMLGGRDSFGAGGWANTDIADILPVEIHPGDGQLEPEGGLKVVPNVNGLESYVLRLDSDPAKNRQIWDALPPIPGANRLGPAKKAAIILAQTPDGREPLMVLQDNVGKGRVLVFGGETWPWYRFSELSQAAHRRFWRQVILWLSHKEDQGENQINLTLAQRRISIGEKLDLTVTARDGKGDPLTDVQFETVIESLGPKPTKEPVTLFNQGNEYHANYFATGEPGEYRVSVRGHRNGQELGRDSARFLVYEDNRELDNPAADFGLLRQIAQVTGGRTIPPEQLAAYLKTIDADDITESVVQKEVRLWDNWPFFLLFIVLLTLEWWLRKRHGWV